MLHRLARLALAAALFFGSVAPAGAVAPFHFETTPGRLPKTVVPTDYRIAVTPNAAAKTLRGSETIALDVRVSLASGEQVDIEMQSQRRRALPERVRRAGGSRLRAPRMGTPRRSRA